MSVLSSEQAHDLLVAGLGKTFVVRADGLKTRVDNDSEDPVGDVLQPQDSAPGRDRDADKNLAGALFPGGQNRGFHGRAGGEAVINNHDDLIAEIIFLALLKFELVLVETLIFLPDDFS